MFSAINCFFSHFLEKQPFWDLFIRAYHFASHSIRIHLGFGRLALLLFHFAPFLRRTLLLLTYIHPSYLGHFVHWIKQQKFSFHLQTRVGCLKRSPMPKLGDLLPKVPGKWWLNSQCVGPEIDLNLDPFEKEYFALDGEKFTLSWVIERHLCFELWVVLILLQTEP